MFKRPFFTEEHEMFRDMVRRFVAAEITPFHQQWEADGMVSREVWRKAGAAGLLLCEVPEALGGPGGDFLHSVIVTEELSKAGASGPFFPLHSDIVAPYIVKYGTSGQRERWLPPMARGEMIAAIAMTEPSGGSDLQNMRTTAQRRGDEYCINGQKTFISNGQLANLIVLAAKTDAAAAGAGISLFLVETDRPGFVRGRLLKKVGLKAQDTSELFFENLMVPASNMLGEEGRGFSQLTTELARERLLVAIRSSANAEAAIEWTKEYVTQRSAFGRLLSENQNTQFKIAEVSTQATMLRAFVDRCIELLMRGELDAVTAAMVKLAATEAQGKIIDECLQLFGGYGYMWEYPIARAYADARVSRIIAGSSEIMKMVIGRALLHRR